MSRTLFSLAGFQVITDGRFWVIAEAVGAVLFLLFGMTSCSTGKSTSSGTGSANPPNLTGNWEVNLNSSAGQGIGRFGLFLSNVSTTVIGAWQGTTGCASTDESNPVTGVFSNPNLNLNGGNVGTVSLSASVSSEGNSFAGTYTQDFGVSCKDSGTATGTRVASFAGQWVGTGQSQTTGEDMTIALTLTEQGTDARGFPALTGSAKVSGVKCLDGTGTFTGDQQGLLIGPWGSAFATIMTTSGSDYINVWTVLESAGTLPLSDNSNTVAMGYACASGIDSGLFTLVRQ